jgi:hypothetical protein
MATTRVMLNACRRKISTQSDGGGGHTMVRRWLRIAACSKCFPNTRQRSLCSGRLGMRLFRFCAGPIAPELLRGVLGENDGRRAGGGQKNTRFQNESLNRSPAQIRRRLSQARASSSTFGTVIGRCVCLSRLGKDKNLVSIAGPRKGRWEMGEFDTTFNSE